MLRIAPGSIVVETVLRPPTRHAEDIGIKAIKESARKSRHHNSNSIYQQFSLLFHFYFNLVSPFDIHSNFKPNQQPINVFKMQFTTILASSIIAFASGISALPAAGPNVTIRIFNDISGANSDATVPADNVPRYITSLFQNTAIGNAGFVATSAQLTQFADNTKCTLANTNVPGWTFQLDGRAKNFVDLDGDVTKAVPTWIGGFTFQCTQ